MVICKNCGAKIDDKDVECPYCHAIQLDASEKDYMDKLYKINENMDTLDDEAKRVVGKQIIRHILITIGVLLCAVILGAFMGYGRYNEYHASRSDLNNVDKALAWYDGNSKELNNEYSAGNYARAAEIMNSFEGDSQILISWEHYDFMELYINYYDYFHKATQDIEIGNKLSESEYERIYEHGIEVIAVINGKVTYCDNYKNCDDTELKVIDGWIDEIETYFTDMAITRSEYMDDIDLLYSDGYCSYKEIGDLCQNYYEKYQNRK